MTGSSVEHIARVECEVSAAEALAFMADGMALGEWALGAWGAMPVSTTKSLPEGVVRGYSLFDDQPSWVRPVADVSRMQVDYHVGGDPTALSPRIVARVEALAPGPDGRSRCSITLHATRSPDMSDARWLRLVRCHEVEVLLIEGRLALRAARTADAASADERGQ